MGLHELFKNNIIKWCPAKPELQKKVRPRSKHKFGGWGPEQEQEQGQEQEQDEEQEPEQEKKHEKEQELV